MNKALIINFVLFISGCSIFHSSNECNDNFLKGIWCSKEINTSQNFTQNAVEYEFYYNCVYSSLNDDNYGVIRESKGSYFIIKDTLFIQDELTETPEKWLYSLKGKDDLFIQNLRIAEWRIHLEKTNQHHHRLEGVPRQPKTLDEAIITLKKVVDKDELNKIKEMSKKDLIKLHHGFGTYIRNAFQLYGANDSLRKSCGGEQMHPDDCSMVIINSLWENLQKEKTE